MSSSSPIALINARLLDPASGGEIRGGVLAENGKIVGVGADVTLANVGARTKVIDCSGDVVCPGLIDMCAFIGEPGASHRETIATASRAAAGRPASPTSCRYAEHPTPPVDEAAVVDYLMRRARDTAKVRILKPVRR